METQLLREHEVIPTEDVLRKALGDRFPAFQTLTETITGKEYALTMEWNYYKDGKSWLGKICHKKKTVFWLSVWDKFFQIGFYFTEKHLEGIGALSIDKKIKEDFSQAKAVGKLLPMIIRVYNEDTLVDVLKIIEFKKKQK